MGLFDSMVFQTMLLKNSMEFMLQIFQFSSQVFLVQLCGRQLGQSEVVLDQCFGQVNCGGGEELGEVF